ncbi:Tetratricopeptide repeat protein-like protein [Lachnellula willkommii]|uniref:Tetratricopeptide repeat protein-like protein n=1 Tax=Lachnellula willkommii TaxID=215461 RepID=A0A559MHN0_9HELO|nr:Tetratricopeptide repeat protein-like protein [Lachnellula willkommii]
MPSLTTHDLSILEKIKDPEAGPSAPLLIDDSLPRDPHVSDTTTYQAVSIQERTIISSFQEIELRIAGLKPVSSQPPLSEYLDCIKQLDALIEEYPKYASARNNRAQALRRIYGNGILVRLPDSQSSEEAAPLDTAASNPTLFSVSTTILTDLSTAISLLTPITPFAAISPQAAKTLSQAYTQRGAFYHLTAKRLRSHEAELRIDASRLEARWKTIDFEEHASNDFMLGGRYGNEIAKALAVSANPTAKLCGEMVREAMRKEYAGAT